MKHTSIRLSGRHVALIKATGERPSTIVRRALDRYFQQEPDNEDHLEEVKRLISDQINAHVKAHHFAHTVESPAQPKNIVRANVRDNVLKNEEDQYLKAPLDVRKNVHKIVRGDESTNVRITDLKQYQEIHSDVREILKQIKDIHERGIEPTVSDVANELGLNARSMGNTLRKVGIKAKATRRNQRGGRFYTFDMGEEIDKLLVE